MKQHDAKAFTRRSFIGHGLTLASASVVVPAFLQRSAFGLPLPEFGMSSIPGVDQDRILVVVQLGGGNDGLNTVVPFGEDRYYRARPSIALRQTDVITLSQQQGLGLHPSLSGLKELYDDGLCTVVQGVGYPNPNRSHFMSMDIWQTADTNGIGNGWIGRYLDSQCCGYGKGESGKPEDDDAPQGMPAIAIGREAPLAMQGSRVKPVSFESAELFRWTGEEVHESLREPFEMLTNRGDAAGHERGSNASFLTRTSLDAQISSDLIRSAVGRTPLVPYPRTGLAQQLSMVASMIRAGLKTRVYYVSMGGYDTHAGQGGAQGSHARLLAEFSGAIRAFYADLKSQENDKRVLTMSFSEFGRRVGQNASGGTDHGTAAPMFLFGPMVRPGVHGRHPSMTDLDGGDLKYNTDFRTVYAAVLEKWLSGDTRAVLGQRFRPADVLKV